MFAILDAPEGRDGTRSVDPAHVGVACRGVGYSFDGERAVLADVDFEAPDAQTITDAITEALSTVTTAQITYAARDSDFDGHQIHQGDYLAMYGKSLFATSRDLNAVLRSLAEKVRDTGREYITIFYGEDITEKQASKAAGIFSSVCPHADVNLLSGGQPVYYYLISAE